MYLVGCAYNFCWEHDSLRVAAAPGERLEVAGADPGDGGRADGPSLDDARVVEPADPAAALGRPEAARATAQDRAPGGHGMTTVPCGATAANADDHFSSFRLNAAIPIPATRTARSRFGDRRSGESHVTRPSIPGLFVLVGPRRDKRTDRPFTKGGGRDNGRGARFDREVHLDVNTVRIVHKSG